MSHQEAEGATEELRRLCRASWTTGGAAGLKFARSRAGRHGQLLSFTFQSPFSSFLHPFARTHNLPSAPFPGRRILPAGAQIHLSDITSPLPRELPWLSTTAAITPPPLGNKPVHTPASFYSSPRECCVALWLQPEEQRRLRESSLLHFIEEAKGKGRG